MRKGSQMKELAGGSRTGRQMKSWQTDEGGKELMTDKVLRKRLLRTAVWVGAVFVVLTAVFAVYFRQNAAAADGLMAAYLPKVQSMTNEDGSLSVLRLLRNNIFASALCVGLGLVPFIFLPAFSVLSNAVMVGAVLGLGAASGAMPVAKTVIFGLLPHGIFELPAFFLSMAMGLCLCKLLSRKLLGRAKDGKAPAGAERSGKAFCAGRFAAAGRGRGGGVLRDAGPDGLGGTGPGLGIV